MHVRHSIAVVLTIVIFSIIIGVWITLPGTTSFDVVNSEGHSAVVRQSSPFSTISEIFGEAADHTSEVFEAIGGSTNVYER